MNLIVRRESLVVEWAARQILRRQAGSTCHNLCELSQTADSTSVHTERGGQGFRSPLDNLRKAVSSESGRIIRTGRSA